MKNLQLPRNRKKPSLRNSWLKSHPKPRSSTPEELVLAAPVNVSYVSWIGAQSGCCKIKIPKNTNMDQFWDPTIPSLGESQTISPEKKVLQLISRYLKYVARAPVASCRNILISHPKMVPSGGVPSHPGAPDIRIIQLFHTNCHSPHFWGLPTAVFLLVVCWDDTSLVSLRSYIDYLYNYYMRDPFLREVSFELFMYPSNSMSVHPLSVVSLTRVHR